ncbi:hypothetical protein IWW57_006633, partial [Coemansia sp. S610]
PPSSLVDAASDQTSGAPLCTARRRRRRQSLHRGDPGADAISTLPSARHGGQRLGGSHGDSTLASDGDLSAATHAPFAPKPLSRPPMQEKFYHHHGNQPPLTIPSPPSALGGEAFLAAGPAVAVHGASAESA